MTLNARKLVVITIIATVLMLANTIAIAHWIHGTGLVRWACNIRGTYLTGTALAVIAVLLFLLPSRRLPWMWVRCARRCPVCNHVLTRSGKYCGECGSKF